MSESLTKRIVVMVAWLRSRDRLEGDDGVTLVEWLMMGAVLVVVIAAVGQLMDGLVTDVINYISDQIGV